MENRKAAPTNLPDLLTPEQVAKLLGVNAATLRVWRAGGNGPDFVAFSQRVIRYRADDVMHYIDTHRHAAAEPQDDSENLKPEFGS